LEIKGEYQIASSREEVWRALNDPDTLRKCIPGCESLEQISDTEMQASVMAAIGPVKARFKTALHLENVNPPESYRLVGESKAGAAGFGRGSADVRLAEVDGGTLLSYVADFKVGGKLAQVGSRLVLGATRKTADQFFGQFSNQLDPGARRVGDTTEQPPTTASSRTWLAVGAAVVVLIGLWLMFG
jgi:carbon monoxide dehydrogenase subunit G